MDVVGGQQMDLSSVGEPGAADDFPVDGDDQSPPAPGHYQRCRSGA
ncbi:hypothetical protein ACIA8K_41240 [Catenuloplanes sp. NPDC051500]